MIKTYDAVVIGAGIAGLSVARELAKLNRRVLLLERDRKGGFASRAAAGTLDPYTEANEETPLLKIGLEALQFYPDFLKELEESAPQKIEYEKRGVLYLALSDEDEAFLKRRFEWQNARGFSIELLSDRQVQQAEPAVSKRVWGGVYYPEIAKLNPEKLTTLLFKAVQSQKVEIKTSVKEVSLWKEGEKVKGVQIGKEFVESKTVVIATGAWTGLDPKLGVSVKVKPVRGQILLLRSKRSLYPERVLHTIRYAYIIPWPKERLLIGSTLESVGYNDRVTPEGKKDILTRASEMIEGLRNLPIEKSWAGLRPYSEGGTPLIGPTQVTGLFLATGYYRSGILIGPLAGKLLAEGIDSGKFSPFLQPFFPGRDS